MIVTNSTRDLFPSVVNSWNRARVELGIEVESPFRLAAQVGGADHIAIAFLADFGSENGIIVDGGVFPDFQGDESLRQFAAENMLYYSIINMESYNEYDQGHFIEALTDWGYFGRKTLDWLPQNAYRPVL